MILIKAGTRFDIDEVAHYVYLLIRSRLNDDIIINEVEFKKVIYQIQASIGDFDLWSLVNGRFRFGVHKYPVAGKLCKKNKGAGVFTLKITNKKAALYIAGDDKVKKVVHEEMDLDGESKHQIELTGNINTSHAISFIKQAVNTDKVQSRLITVDNTNPTDIFYSYLSLDTISLQEIETLEDRDTNDKIRLVYVRVGQGPFRKQLLSIYGETCFMSGKCPAESLQAAHIIPHADTNHKGNFENENGLLLRSDLHKLFDDGLIKINDNFVVKVSNKLKDYDLYYELNGKQLAQKNNSIDFDKLKQNLVSRNTLSKSKLDKALGK
jgi:predicted restriction endonuclease